MKETITKRFTITSNYDEICSEEVFSKLLPVLMAYAYSLIEASSLKFKKNKDELSYDFAMEAIKRHLENPSKFDPERNNDLVKYLKYYILKQLISNANSKKSNQKEILYREGDNIHMKVLSIASLDKNIHEEIDYDTAILKIKDDLANFPKLLDVFDLRITKDYKRAEVCEELNITLQEYDNRIRRIKTIAKKTLDFYNQSIS